MNETWIRKKVLSELPAAISPIRTVFQPIFEVDEYGCPAEVHAFECLTRGPANTNFARPDVLFEYARRKGIEPPLDRLCIASALETAAAQSCTSLLSLNLHAATLHRDTGIVDYLLCLFERSGVPPQRIILEVVEHAPAFGGGAFHTALEQLRRAGVQVALDDIGAGQSNYRMMLECEPDYFKLDRYLVTGCQSDPRRRAVLHSLIGLAHQLGGQVVAEGVECTEESVTLASMGCRLIQGYLLGAPSDSLLRGWPTGERTSG